MVNMIKKMYMLLTYADIRHLIILFFLTIFLSGIEIIGITAIMPFISVATDSTLIYTNIYYKYVYDLFGFTSAKEFTIYFGIILVIFYIFRAIYIIFHTYLMAKFSVKRYEDLVVSLFNVYLNLPYQLFISKNINSMVKVVTIEAGQLAFLMQNILIFFSEIMIILILYVLLLMVNVKMTLVLTLILGVKILFLVKTISKRVKQKGEKKVLIQDKINRLVSETFHNFKIIKFISNQMKLLESFNQTIQQSSKVLVSHNTLQVIPKNILEMTGFSLLIGIVTYVVFVQNNVTNVIPIISMYTLALYRILPATSKILSVYNNIVYHSASLNIVYDEIKLKQESLQESLTINFQESIKVNNLSFSYGQIDIIKRINFTINKGEKIAFIGESGSGKSTLVDLICGVLQPKEGTITIDGIILNQDNIFSWRKKIGYIPQSIYLFDGSVAENITFGREYNEPKLLEVLKQANVYDFIMQKDGLNTQVGEGGIQLSGGQKQRIGIARALYGNPEILILDEATSALDTNTESMIMEEIYKVSQNKTLLIIAHRLSTIEKCDKIIDITKNQQC